MNNYAESKKTLDQIRETYGCKGEIIFRTAIQFVVEYGQQTFLNDRWVTEQLDEIDFKHDEAEKQGQVLFVSRDFEKAIFECAEELAEVNTYDLLIYIQRDVWLGGDGIDPQRAMELLKRCISCIEESHDEQSKTLWDLQYIGFSDSELEELGYDYLLDLEEEE